MFYFLYYVVIIANYNMGFYRGRREEIYGEDYNDEHWMTQFD